MRLKNNANFERHKEQISEAIENIADQSASKTGQILYKDMLEAADRFDMLFGPDSDVMPTQQIITLRRDEFHKKCRVMGDWLTQYAPDLKLEWI